MVNYINDGSLIGFWPLSEPSGAPIFTNHSPARAGHPSGISFDLHFGNATSSVIGIDHPRAKSTWPGRANVINPESGTTYTGYMTQGYWKLGTDPSPFSRYLMLGNGTSQTREQTLSRNVAQSGITVGAWIYPNSNGYLNFQNSANLATYSWETESARAHSLIGQFLWGNATGGYHLGVSGHLDGGAQYSTPSVHRLSAYLSLESSNTTVPLSIRTPIESGCFIHIAFTYRFIDGTSNQVVLYKNGRVAASGVTTVSLDLSNANILSRAFGIGNSDTASAGTNNYAGSSGWNHLVSGVYMFRRVLNEGEMLDMHQNGGLQPAPDNRLPTKEVLINDSNLLGYYPFRSIGLADASPNHIPLVNISDEGNTNDFIVTPGPFIAGGCMQNANTTNNAAIVATSGLVNSMLSGRNWTIGVFAAPGLNGGGRDDNMIFSMGGVSNTISNGSPTANGSFNFGMALTEIGVNPSVNRMRFSAYTLNNLTTGAYDVDISTSGYHSACMSHYAVVYDDQTKGLGVYYNGIQQFSGALPFSLTDALIKVAGSGYPLMFSNGVQDAIQDTNARGVFNNGGNKMQLGPILIARRPLLPAEVRAVALSGINMTSLYRTVYDPRLMGYWPCNDFSMDRIIVQDRARVWNLFPGHLIRGDTNYKWSYAYTGSTRYDLFKDRTLPPELSSYGNLGITSGVFAVQAGSSTDNFVSDATTLRSAIVNLSSRYKPVLELNNKTCQNILGEYIISYEVTPSGTIPSTLLGTVDDTSTGKFDFNSTLHVYGNIGGTTSPTSQGEVRSFLTTINNGLGSGITLVFQGREGTFSAANIRPMVSGTIPFGVPSKVLFHSKFNNPYNVNGETTGQSTITTTLWISGVKVQSTTSAASASKLWSTQSVNSSNESYVLTFGGELGDPTFSTQINRDGGLGNIYMRNMFVMRGVFEEGEVAALAASGIQDPSISNFTPNVTSTQVTISDTNLQGYWRFNGITNGLSGIRDLSLKAHNLTAIAQTRINTNGANPSTNIFKFIPGPLEQSDLKIKCSGLTYTDTALGGTVFYPPFAVSGADFDRPNAGFSVGFLMSKRNDVIVASTADIMLAYGILGSNSTSSSTVDLNRGWVIVNDVGNNIKMVMSTAGNGYYDNTATAAQSGQIVCGTYEGDGIYEDLRGFDNYQRGNMKVPRLDGWSHYCWTFDSTIGDLVCYVNGNEVDRKTMPIILSPYTNVSSGVGPAIPDNHGARMITFLNHQNSAPWDFNTNNINDQTSVITDVFYFSKTLTQPEVRYIAQHGIDNTQITVASGVVGGYIQGQDTGSGIIGSFIKGQDTGSGIIGGLMLGASLGSGVIGGYVSGIIFATGTIGGFIQGRDFGSGIIGGFITGSDIGSGIIGGYIRGLNTGSGLIGGYLVGSLSVSGIIGGYIVASDIGSGIIGGFILGGIVGSMQFDGGFTVQAIASKNFDSQLQVSRYLNSDFDARIVVFEAETGPAVDIIIPHNTVNISSAPFNQYLIGAASGTQGKSIVSTRWTFGDFSSPLSVAQSGAGLYPTQHYFANSGLYICKFEAIDSNGIHASATRIINAASGIDPVNISLSGIPRSGPTGLTVAFITNVDTAPQGVNVISNLVNFDDGQSTITTNPTHVYNVPGTFKPIWTVQDSRGFIWNDSLESGPDNE